MKRGESLHGFPLYVREQGAEIKVQGGVFKVETPVGDKREIRLIEVSQICLFGNIRISPQALHKAFDRGIPVLFFSSSGSFRGMGVSVPAHNALVRTGQYRAAEDPERSLAVSRAIISAKIRNCRTILARNGTGVPKEILSELAGFSKAALSASGQDSLLGLEGMATRKYFECFGLMLKPGRTPEKGGGADFFDFETRSRRPPKDPGNALLSLLYSLLARDVTVALAGIGLDPFKGFLHCQRSRKPALALDMMEEFRPLICDSAALRLINNGMLGERDFKNLGGWLKLSTEALKRVLEVYEGRLAEKIAHPESGASVEYRTVLHLQAQALARFCQDKGPYTPFTTR